MTEKPEGPQASLWHEVIEECSVTCNGRADEFLRNACIDEDACWSPRRQKRTLEGYEWVKTIIDRGVPDGRSRLILYVISRYLLNILSLTQEEALREIEVFLENSCRNYGRCGGIYSSWVRNVVKYVSQGGWKPWSLERIKREDPQLYEIVQSVLST